MAIVAITRRVQPEAADPLSLSSIVAALVSKITALVSRGAKTAIVQSEKVNSSLLLDGTNFEVR